MIAVESLVFLLGGIVLAVVLTQIFGRSAETARQQRATAPPVIRLVRQAQAAAGFEETRLLINDQVILTASSEGLRLADYADEVEQLEAIATRMAAALGVNVELARVGGRETEIDEGVPVRRLPKEERDRGPERSATFPPRQHGADH